MHKFYHHHFSLIQPIWGQLYEFNYLNLKYTVHISHLTTITRDLSVKMHKFYQLNKYTYVKMSVSHFSVCLFHHRQLLIINKSTRIKSIIWEFLPWIGHRPKITFVGQSQTDNHWKIFERTRFFSSTHSCCVSVSIPAVQKAGSRSHPCIKGVLVQQEDSEQKEKLF